MTKNRTEIRVCNYVFTEKEKAQIAADLANGVAELARMEERKKSVASQIKAEIDAKQSSVNAAAEKLRSGFEMRDIECEVIYAYIDDVIRWVRTDNGEIAFERRMRPEERQMKVPFDDDPGVTPNYPGAIGTAMMDAAEKGELEKLRPKKGSDVKSVTLSHGGRSVTLEAKE